MGTQIKYPSGEGELYLIDEDEDNIFEFFSSVEVRSVKEAKEVWPLLEDKLLDKHYFDVEEDIEAIFMHYAKTTGLDVELEKDNTRDSIKKILVDIYQNDGRLEDEATNRIMEVVNKMEANG